MFGLTLHAWEEISVWAIGITAIAACALFVASRITILLQREEIALRNSEFETFKIEAAHSTAKLEKEAAVAKLELEKVRSHASWRRLDSNVFVELLKGKPKANIEVLYLSGDPDSFRLASRIVSDLIEAGWPLGDLGRTLSAPNPNKPFGELMHPALSYGAQPWGVTVVTHDPIADNPYPPYKALFDAFAKAMPAESAQGGMDTTLPHGALRIVVAPRVPLFESAKQ